MSNLWMLDTNTISYLIREPDGAIAKQLATTELSSVCISVVTEAELLYGLQKNSGATALKQLINAFLIRVATLPWTSEVAAIYAVLRTELESRGLAQGNLDLMIAAHARALDATLVTSDKALLQLGDFINVVNWRGDM